MRLPAPGWRRAGTAFALGALGSLLFAPFHFFIVGFIAFGGLFLLLAHDGGGRSGRQAFWTGWFFGWGHFVAGLYWIASTFLVEPDKFAWMIPFAVLLLPALLAFFPAIATWLAWRLAAPGAMRALALAAAWTLLEAARGAVLTGFPWNLAGYAWGVHWTAMQAASWIGVYGLSFLAILLFTAPGLWLTGAKPARRAAIAFTVLPLLVALAATPRALSFDDRTAFTARLVQANIQQTEKWRRELMSRHFDALIALSTRDGTEPDIIIWPETATTFFLTPGSARLRALSAVAGRTTSGLMITGAPRIDERGVYNSAIAVGADNRVVSYADKHHLVPFGEYLPLRPMLQAVGLEKLAQGRGDFRSGPPDRLLALPGLADARVLICYEAIFPALADVTPRPGWLLNLSNDGWFGELTGPDQHFDMARFRAVEQGLPLVRAAGTGISASVSPTGRVLASIPLGQAGVLDAPVTAAMDRTIFSRFGGAPVIGFCFLILLAVRIMRLRIRRP